MTVKSIPGVSKISKIKDSFIPGIFLKMAIFFFPKKKNPLNPKSLKKKTKKQKKPFFHFDKC